MLEQIKNFFTKRFIHENEKKEEIPSSVEKSFPGRKVIPVVLPEISATFDASPESFESVHIKPSPESVIKRAKRALKYRY